MAKVAHLPVTLRRSSAALLVIWLCMAAVAILGMRPAAASPGQRLSWTVRVDNQDVSKFNSDRPLNLAPGGSATIYVQLDNRTGQRPVSVRSVRLESRVLGLAFFSYETRVDLKAGPGKTDIRQYNVDLLGLGQQATGLLPARVLLLDANDNPLASRSLVVRVHGSLGSVYGTFGLAVAAITVVLLASALWTLFRGRQHANRWRRGLLFAAPGFGVGFILTFTLSAAGVLVPSADKWTVFIVAGGAIGFLAGYLTPNPYDEEREARGATSADEDGLTSVLHYEGDEKDRSESVSPSLASVAADSEPSSEEFPTP